MFFRFFEMNQGKEKLAIEDLWQAVFEEKMQSGALNQARIAKSGVMVKNLTTTASSAGNGGKRQAIESLTRRVIALSTTVKAARADAGSSAGAPARGDTRRGEQDAGLRRSCGTARPRDPHGAGWKAAAPPRTIASPMMSAERIIREMRTAGTGGS